MCVCWFDTLGNLEHHAGAHCAETKFPASINLGQVARQSKPPIMHYADWAYNACSDCNGQRHNRPMG